jgi:hypothetical protein
MTGLKAAVTLAAILLLAAEATAQRQMENLGRGMVAIHQGGGKVYVMDRPPPAFSGPYSTRPIPLMQNKLTVFAGRKKGP